MTGPFLIFSAIGLLVAVTYIFIISKYLRGWRAVPEWNLPKGFQPKTKVSIIVPARNEEANILPCLRALASQNFPPEMFEVIVVDDLSTDATSRLVSDFSKKNPNVKLVNLSDFLESGEVKSFKKKAIETAIGQATGQLIATTDADCIVPENCLALLVSFFEKKQVQFIAAPVALHSERNLLERFQSLDLLGMMGVTAAGIRLRWMNMCNGANLAYPKAAFHAVGGFAGIDQVASGDDVLLMQKMAARFPQGIGFLKNTGATVLTQGKPDLPAFISQRLRWATKSAGHLEWSTTIVLGMVFFFCCSIVAALLLSLAWGWKCLGLALALLAVKLVADYFFLGEMSRYFGRQDLMRSYLPSQFLHIVYIVVVGILGNLKKKYEWHGRAVL